MKRALLEEHIEALLFVAARPFSLEKIASITKSDKREVLEALEALRKKLSDESRGIRLLKTGSSWQFVTSPDTGKLIGAYLKEEVSGELTKPSLEALSIIAYRGPVTKAEVEQIRGVNCSLIIRNLLMRGFIEEVRDKGIPFPRYQVTPDFLSYIGCTSVEELPQYEKLNKNVALETFLHEEREKASA